MRVTISTKPDMLRLWGCDESPAAMGLPGSGIRPLNYFRGLIKR